MSVSRTKIVKTGGAEKVYKILPATIVAFEHHFSIGLAGLTTMEQLYWISWDAETRAEKAAGKVTKLFEDWLNDIEDVEEVPDERRPTVEAPSLS
jgi:hypothetical protein